MFPGMISFHAHLLPLPGVPLKRMVAGVAMGLILGDNGNFTVLTDILGSGESSNANAASVYEKSVVVSLEGRSIYE